MDRLTPDRRSWLMSRVKSADTTPEWTIRRLVFGMGYRYRLHDGRLPGKPDLVFSSRRKVIFVHGCFWHGHEGCRYAKPPKTNTPFWTEKFVRNKERDHAVQRKLNEAGWQVLVVWQCELKNIEQLKRTLHDFLEEQQH